MNNREVEKQQIEPELSDARLSPTKINRLQSAKKLLAETLQRDYGSLLIRSERDTKGSFLLLHVDSLNLVLRQGAPFKDNWKLLTADDKVALQGEFRDILSHAKELIEQDGISEHPKLDFSNHATSKPSMAPMSLDEGAEILRSVLIHRFPDCEVSVQDDLLLIAPEKSKFRALRQVTPEKDHWELISLYSNEEPKGSLSEMLQQIQVELIALIHSEKKPF